MPRIDKKVDLASLCGGIIWTSVDMCRRSIFNDGRVKENTNTHMYKEDQTPLEISLATLLFIATSDLFTVSHFVTSW